MPHRLPRPARIYLFFGLAALALGFIPGGPSLLMLISAPWGTLGMFALIALPAPLFIPLALATDVGGVVVNAMLISGLMSSRSRLPNRRRTVLAAALVGAYASMMTAALFVGFRYPGDGDGLSFLYAVILAMPWAMVFVPLGPMALVLGFTANCFIIWRAVAGRRPARPEPPPSWWEQTPEPLWPRS